MRTIEAAATGQVTLSHEALEHSGVQAGDKIRVRKPSNGRAELIAARPKGDITDVFNFLKRENDPFQSIEETGALAVEGWAGKR